MKVTETAGQKYLRWFLVAVASGAMVWLYFWIQAPAISQLLGRHSAKTAYYNRLVDGFRSGHLYLAGDPAPEMAKLKNPYDPLENAPYRLHDATYYKGKYYLYFGPTPALVLFWPYVAITGEYLWHRQAVAVFGSAAFLISVGLLCAIRRRYFPRAGAWTMFFAVIGLGFVNTIPIVLRRPDVWEVPITCAAVFVLLALVAIWRAIHWPSDRTGWTVIASAFYGLAIGARPPVLLGAAMLLVPALYAWRRDRADWVGVRRLVLAAVLPVTVAGLALLSYNWLRFENPLEFGQRYQLAGVDNTQVTFFGGNFFWYHLRLYLWEPVRWFQYFPFVRGIEIPPPPAGQLGVESMFGLLTNTSFVWLALLAPWLGDRGEARASWRWFVFAAGVYSAIAGATVMMFGGACNRYFVDFVPPLVLLAAAGALAIDHSLSRAARAWRWLGRAVWVAATVFSAAFIFFSSCEHLGLLRLRDPLSYESLARFFNWPVAAVETLRGVRSGPLELTVKLPPFTTRRAEPYLVTGTPNEADYLWIEYVSPDTVRFGIEHTNYGGPISEMIKVDYAREHTITLQFRSLYPPAEHAYWESAEGAALLASRDELRLMFDDREVLRGKVAGYDAAPQTRFIGYSPYVQAFGSRFTGEILRQRTLSAPTPEQARAPGPVAFKFWMPTGVPPNWTEPLVQTGETGKADTVWIRYVDDRHVTFGLDHWGYGGPETPPIEVDFAQVHRFEIRMGSLYPEELKLPANDARRRRLEVKFNGVVVLERVQDFHPAQANQVFFGRNPAGASTTQARTSGRLAELWRLGAQD
ncbi:MAG: hypothetical protein HZA32_09970 [Opitutae bacterium]|nr:hypothetical protein [Opitutae bacterium]